MSISKMLSVRFIGLDRYCGRELLRFLSSDMGFQSSTTTAVANPKGAGGIVDARRSNGDKVSDAQRLKRSQHSVCTEFEGGQCDASRTPSRSHQHTGANDIEGY
jgi:hypothetical protein